jgi:antitoxin HicB
MNMRRNDMATQRPPLSYYLDMSYPYIVIPDEGSFFIKFPDLPGCISQVEHEHEIVHAAEEIRTLWIEGEYGDGATIPEPVFLSEFSGRFVTRIPKSLHRDLVMAAKSEGISLNAYVGHLLTDRNAAAQMSARLDSLESRLAALGDQVRETAAPERQPASVS